MVHTGASLPGLLDESAILHPVLRQCAAWKEGAVWARLVTPGGPWSPQFSESSDSVAELETFLITHRPANQSIDQPACRLVHAGSEKELESHSEFKCQQSSMLVVCRHSVHLRLLVSLTDGSLTLISRG